MFVLRVRGHIGVVLEALQIFINEYINFVTI
jgi:hypothetical protein